VKRPVSAWARISAFAAHAPQCQFREDQRVALAGDEGLEHGPAGLADDVRDDRGELDPGVLQQLLQSLDLAGALADDLGARRLVSQLTQLGYQVTLQPTEAT
jgi:hypothetical protein